MQPREQALWSQLENFDIDDPASAYPFTARLANENGWQLTFARRVVTEYRRFLFLAAAAEHPVAPPDAVDQAWHLHLLYTRSYWDDLCGRILQRPMHHEPTRGGGSETEKFGDWYVQTLASYRRLFGAEPPADIWPSPAVLEGKVANFRRVNLARFALVPRLRWPHWIKSHSAAPVAALALFGMPAGVLVAGGWNVLEYNGPDFLKFYLPLAALSMVLAFLTRYLLLRHVPVEGTSQELTPDDAAYLAAGPHAALGAAIGALHRLGAIELRQAKSSTAGRSTLHLAQPTSENLPQSHEVLPTLQREVLRAVAADPGITLDALRRLMLPITEPVRSGLEQRGFLYEEATVRLARIAALAPLLIVALLGIVKTGIGVQREKPVVFVVIATAAVVVAACFAARRVYRTTAGTAALDALRRRHVSLATVVTGGAPLAPQDLGFAFGLFGLGMLAGTAASPLAAAFPHPKRQADGNWTDGGSSWSSSGGDSSSGSSCSSSSCGGSSCGGSGCGGCGGGGD